MKPWTLKKSTYLIRDLWLRLRADTCETSLGVEVIPYYVFECNDWVNIVAVDSHGQVLITHQYRHEVGKICAEIPLFICFTLKSRRLT
jgi:hypothetical protein